uniref:Putative transport permease ycf38 n=1 Tax=Grateloupia turuturu TaxID=118375 RepID=A0A6B9PIA8_9FLOR|nr:putative transport permease ycf38 [Grateloupia turuturu]QHD45274.1 putative transport permease ycf38 [Grateloupia turuturu]UXC96818.1 putative transport permease ycf38 [Grateloupia turuturu]
MINTLQQSSLKYSIKLEPRKIIRIKRDKKNLLRETYALTKRLYIQLIRRPSTLVSGIIQPLLWLILFGALFQNAPVGLVTSNVRYGKFLSPGIIVFTAFTGSINAGLPLMFDREFGFLNRLLTAPLASRDSLLISSMIFIATTTILQTFFIIIFTLILFKSITNFYNIYIILTITLLIALSIGSISLYLAFILPGHIEFLAFILIINLPTLFSSTALAPLSFMPYWLQIIASINPLTYAIESIRYISLNNSNSIIQTVWCNLEINECIYLLIFINIISFLIVKNLISYKFE